ncbi:MAG TPA: SDR family oxidoreductase [Longimicrobiaceae bacterium]|nr:SDR family oxidoreductase [Longimicrobiaceae bacterium]
MIAVTGATGHLGRLAIESLLERGVPADQIVAIARSAEKARGLADRGVQVRLADYSRPEELAAALQGVDKLLLISASEVGQRLAQHRNILAAARQAGVKLIAYTSILHADTSRMQLAGENRATEELICASGIPFVLLRNGWYLENYTDNLAPALEHGALLGSAGEGRVSAAARADFAEAAAVVVTEDGHANRVYELAGDEAFTLSELADIISRESGKPVEYRDLPEEEYAKILLSFGLPEPLARALADSDTGITRGELEDGSGDLRRLIGRPTTTARAAVAAALAG